MSTITIEIPKKVLQNGGVLRLLAVEPEEFENNLRRQWETGEDIEDTKRLLKAMQNPKNGFRMQK